MKQLRFELSGHTDDVGSTSYNMNLSQQRAESARVYLIENFDVSPDAIDAKGYGETRPIIEDLLTDAGLEVVAAEDGQAALEAFQAAQAAAPFEGVLADINMPRLDGLELTLWMIADFQHLLSSTVEVDWALASFNAGRRALIQLPPTWPV